MGLLAFSYCVQNVVCRNSLYFYISLSSFMWYVGKHSMIVSEITKIFFQVGMLFCFIHEKMVEWKDQCFPDIQDMKCLRFRQLSSSPLADRRGRIFNGRRTLLIPQNFLVSVCDWARGNITTLVSEDENIYRVFSSRAGRKFVGYHIHCICLAVKHIICYHEDVIAIVQNLMKKYYYQISAVDPDKGKLILFPDDNDCKTFRLWKLSGILDSAAKAVHHSVYV